MAVKTVNSYGKISISDDAIEMIAGSTALECYGVVDLVPKRLSDSFATIFKKQRLKKFLSIMRKATGDVSLIYKGSFPRNIKPKFKHLIMEKEIIDYTNFLKERELYISLLITELL